MPKKFLGLVTIIFLLGVWLLVKPLVWKQKQTNGNKILQSPEQPYQGLAHEEIFFEPDSFFFGVSDAVSDPLEINFSKAKGGIVPHHLYPGKLLSEFFLQLKETPPDTIILIGPNHFERGQTNVITSQLAWDTRFGKVLPESNIIAELLKQNLAQAKEGVMTLEHSMGGIMPYIAYYLPQTNVVPIIFSSSLTLEEEINFSSALTKIINTFGGKIFVLASVDFSHYLNSLEAKKKDAETLLAMQNFDFRKISNYKDDHLDSPPSIVILLKTMELLGTKNFRLIKNTNSGVLGNKPYELSTSYFSAIFEK